MVTDKDEAATFFLKALHYAKKCQALEDEKERVEEITRMANARSPKPAS